MPSGIPACFDFPDAQFVLLPVAAKAPPNKSKWQERGNTYAEAFNHHGNGGLIATPGQAVVDIDLPGAWEA